MKSRILIISPNWIGDAVMAQPLLQLLRARYPASPIDVLAPARVAPVWRAMREVDTVMESPLKQGALQLCARWQLARRLRQSGYTQAFVLPNTFKFALIPWFAGIAQRVGYRGEMRDGLLNVIHREGTHAPRPMISFYAALATAPASMAPPLSALPRPTLWISKEQRQQAMQRHGFPSDRPLIIFAPGAEFGPAKRWPAAYFGELARLIFRQYPAAHIAVLGSAQDTKIGAEIVAIAPAVRNLAGATTLSEAMALIAHAAVMVSNDSGLLHIASALNRPVVALYGPTDPAHAPPFSDIAQSVSLHLDCAPCRQRTCPLGHHDCMRNITAQHVGEIVQSILNATPICPR